MKTKIKFIITSTSGYDMNSERQTTIDSLPEKDYTVITSITPETEPKLINEMVTALDSEYTHVCIVPEGSIVQPIFSECTTTYFEDNAILLPIVEWSEKEDDIDTFKAFLNAYLFQSSLTEEVGMMDLKYASQQLDNTLYGALIPVSILKEHKLKENFTYYNHNEYFCRLASKEVSIVGVPKNCLKLNADYSLREVSNEAKTAYFSAVLERYKTEEDLAVVV